MIEIQRRPPKNARWTHSRESIRSVDETLQGLTDMGEGKAQTCGIACNTYALRNLEGVK
jgi:hypothetical protein